MGWLKELGKNLDIFHIWTPSRQEKYTKSYNESQSQLQERQQQLAEKAFGLQQENFEYQKGLDAQQLALQKDAYYNNVQNTVKDANAAGVNVATALGQGGSVASFSSGAQAPNAQSPNASGLSMPNGNILGQVLPSIISAIVSTKEHKDQLQLDKRRLASEHDIAVEQIRQERDLRQQEIDNAVNRTGNEAWYQAQLVIDAEEQREEQHRWHDMQYEQREKEIANGSRVADAALKTANAQMKNALTNERKEQWEKIESQLRLRLDNLRASDVRWFNAKQVEKWTNDLVYLGHKLEVEKDQHEKDRFWRNILGAAHELNTLLGTFMGVRNVDERLGFEGAMTYGFGL